MIKTFSDLLNEASGFTHQAIIFDYFDKKKGFAVLVTSPDEDAHDYLAPFASKCQDGLNDIYNDNFKYLDKSIGIFRLVEYNPKTNTIGKDIRGPWDK